MTYDPLPRYTPIAVTQHPLVSTIIAHEDGRLGPPERDDEIKQIPGQLDIFGSDAA